MYLTFVGFLYIYICVIYFMYKKVGLICAERKILLKHAIKTICLCARVLFFC